MNDSVDARTVKFALLTGVNISAALASGAFGAVAIVNPSALVDSSVTSDRATGFYGDMYGLRALVITAGLITASLTMRRAPRVAAGVLLGGGLVQLGDVAIAARTGTPGVVGAGIAAAVHLASACVLERHVRRSR